MRPDEAPARIDLGHTLLELGRPAEAEPHLRAGVRLKPDDAPTHNNLGAALWQLGKPDEAVACLREVVRLKPDDPQARNSLGNTLGRLGRYGEASACYREAIRLKPDFAQAHNNLAWLLATCTDQAVRDPGQAIEYARRAAALAPKMGFVWNTLGVALYRTGDDKAAIAELETAMSLRAGGDGFDWFFLAMAHSRLGERDKARKWFDQAVQWMDRYARQSREFRRFRAEAEAMLAAR